MSTRSVNPESTESTLQAACQRGRAAQWSSLIAFVLTKYTRVRRKDTQAHAAPVLFSHHRKGAAGALVKMADEPTPGNNSTIVYFTCKDCSKEAGRAVSAGGKVMKGKFPIGEHGFIALVTDPEGNCIGLHSMK